MATQNFSNHTKFVPAFHFFTLPVLVLNLGWSCYRWKISEFSFGGLVNVLLGVALILGFLFARLFALTVQDRVIRLEERLRLERLLPDDLKLRIGEFSISQLVGLRFACDAELPALARKVLAENLRDRKQIKRLVQNWKADDLRV
ncbi:MAG TPA: DUF6526 family protein [Candidatus Sulfotelmatobacter sp.]|jgi:uncharacterized membrane protein YciS (DUF1049 family)|nr:DUF6526 family protein [Candidatus Sulfotelmatobacter sp.]